MATTIADNSVFLTEETFAVAGMTCGGCANGVQRALARVDGVAAATVDLATATATVTYNSAAVRPAELRAAVADAGYVLKDQNESSARPARSKGGCCGG